MIKFCGELSHNSKMFLIKLEKRTLLLSALIVDLIASIPIILLTIYFDWVFALAFFPLFIIMLIPIMPLNEKRCNLIFPKTIFIKEDIIICKGKGFEVSNQVDVVKKIIDNGDWYQIYFKFPYKSLRYLCQKNLLTEGSLEEFEELFKDKIVKLKK